MQHMHTVVSETGGVRLTSILEPPRATAVGEGATAFGEAKRANTPAPLRQQTVGAHQSRDCVEDCLWQDGNPALACGCTCALAGCYIFGYAQEVH